MSLSLFAANLLIRDYLNGRSLPRALHDLVVRKAETRLLNGLMPVLDEAICTEVESNATEPTAWSAESVLETARQRGKSIRAASRVMGRPREA